MTRPTCFISATVLLAAMLVSCSAPAVVPPTVTPPAVPTILPDITRAFPTLAATALPTPAGPTATPLPLPAVEALMNNFFAALADHDGDKILSYYSKDVQAYDATETYANSYSTVAMFYKTMYPGKTFDQKITSFMISADGQQIAALAIWSEPGGSGSADVMPTVHLYQLKDGKIVMEYDYYGGADGPLPVQVIPPEANQPAAAAVREQAETALKGWQAAFNSRDAKALMAVYADQAQVTEVVSPKWLVYRKGDFEGEMTARFNRAEFDSRVDTYFISANGRFAAVQGTLKEKDIAKRPVVLIVELENGKIIRQFTYWK